MHTKEVELIYAITDNMANNPEKASSDLYKLTEAFSSMIFNQEYEKLTEFKRILDDEFISESITDYKSYNLGKAHTLIELVNCLKNSYEEQETIQSLTSFENEILCFIGREHEATLKQLTEEIPKVKEHISNTLEKLYKKNLINRYQVTKHTWYSLTLLGKKAVQCNLL